MLASKRDWKRLRQPYDPMSYKRIRRDKEKRNPCPTDCGCNACKAYSRALQTCNSKPVITLLGFVPAVKK